MACSTQPKSGLLASCQGQRVYLGKPFNLHKHAWERSSPWENSQHQFTNLKVCGWSFASARHRSTLPRAKVVFRLSVSLASENRFWGRWGKAGYWNGPELSRTISKLGTISNLTGTISFFRKKWLELFHFFGKKGWNYFIFRKNCWNYFICSEESQKFFHFSKNDTGTFLSNSPPIPV